MSGFLVRLDAALTRGLSEKMRSQAMEWWHRPPEEWERERGVSDRSRHAVAATWLEMGIYDAIELDAMYTGKVA